MDANTMEREMKEAIKKSGGLFYQYRPCRRDDSTIYDIENIRHGVVYAQTPLNMNDPFDSQIGFSAEQIYDECISMFIESINNKIDDDYLKIIIELLIKNKLLGTMASFITLIKNVKKELKKHQKAMHKGYMKFSDFIRSNMTQLYSKLPTKIKNEYTKDILNAIMLIIIRLDNVEITEESLLSIVKLDNALDEIQKSAEKTRDELYPEIYTDFVSQLTVSCFSASGWNNQLMWSHYANSYSGICVEYDFTRIKKHIGFIYPVKYQNTRPTISMKDLGIAGFDLSSDKRIIKSQFDVERLISQLLIKNTCWDYEREWRIINIGERNTPIFLELDCINSITFGFNMDKVCKRLLMDVCREKNISCYEIVLSKESFQIERKPLDLSASFDLKEELEYVILLYKQTTNNSKTIVQISDSVKSTAGYFNTNLCIEMLQQVKDMTCEYYFLKLSMNRIAFYMATNGIDDEELLMSLNQNEIINSIANFLSANRDSLATLRSALDKLFSIGAIMEPRYNKSVKIINDIIELSDKIESFEWIILSLPKND